MIVIRTIDAHAAGEPLRLIVDGFPRVEGRRCSSGASGCGRNSDHLRTALMLEPRGHADMYGALLTAPVTPGSHAGVLFMHNEGYSTMCGHGVIAVETIALERGLIMPGGDGASIVLDAPAGRFGARARHESRRRRRAERTASSSVSFVNVPSFVLHGGAAGEARLAADSRRCRIRRRVLRDRRREAAGCRSTSRACRSFADVGMAHQARGRGACCTVAHPTEPGLEGIYGTIFTGAADAAAPTCATSRSLRRRRSIDRRAAPERAR